MLIQALLITWLITVGLELTVLIYVWDLVLLGFSENWDRDEIPWKSRSAKVATVLWSILIAPLSFLPNLLRLFIIIKLKRIRYIMYERLRLKYAKFSRRDVKLHDFIDIYVNSKDFRSYLNRLLEGKDGEEEI